MSDPARSDKIPQPRPRPLLGNAMDVDPEAGIQSFMRLSRELGPIYRMSFPGREVLVLSSHDLVAEACDETRFAKYIHGALNNIRDFAGDGLFTARNEEPNWSKAHRLLMPAFGPAAMRGYFADMLDITDQMLTKWERLGPEESLNVSDNMTRLTLDTIALCGFAYRFNSFYQKELHPFVESMVRALQEAGRRGRRLPLQNRLMFMTRQKYEADAEFMDGVTARLITQRKRLPPEEAPRDLLSLMLTAKDPLTGERLDEQNIRYQLVTFLIAGHETTSGLLSFAVHLLLKHPEVLQRAQAEVDRVLGAQLPRFEQVAQLGYIEQILRETLRLYPTAPAFAVQAKHDTVLGGRYPLKKGQALMVLTPMLHRDPAVWSEPERFDPDRFAPGAREKLPPKAWLPFGNGERSCIGRAFALQEATLVIAMLLQRFTFWSPTPYELKIKETLTLKPEGLVVRARLRKTIERGATPRPPAMPAPVASSLPDAAGVVAHRTPLLVLYGSNSGSAEAFARRIASDGEARGYVTHVAPLDDYAGKLSPGGAVAIVTASYNGQPPDNAAAFVAWLGSVPAGSLAGVRYTVFGCGNRDWVATYQAVPKLIDQRLHDAGAEALFARGEADASADFFGDFERWYAPLWNRLGESLGITSRPVDLGPLYTVEAVPPASLELVKQNKLELVTLVENRELVNLQATAAPARSKRHIEFALPAGSTYSAGDYLALLPENHPELIARAASRFGLRLDAAIVLHSSRGAMAASLPTGRPISVQELLGRHVELSAPATRKDIERLAANNPCPAAPAAPPCAQHGRRALQAGDPRQAGECARSAYDLPIVRALTGGVFGDAAGDAGAAVLDLLVTAVECDALHADRGGGGCTRAVRHRSVSWHLFELPHPAASWRSDSCRSARLQRAVPSAGR